MVAFANYCLSVYQILGTLRNILTIAAGVMIFQEKITVLETVGYAVALCGFAVYNMAKMGYINTTVGSEANPTSGLSIRTTESTWRRLTACLRAAQKLASPRRFIPRKSSDIDETEMAPSSVSEENEALLSGASKV